MKSLNTRIEAYRLTLGHPVEASKLPCSLKSQTRDVDLCLRRILDVGTHWLFWNLRHFAPTTLGMGSGQAITRTWSRFDFLFKSMG